MDFYISGRAQGKSFAGLKWMAEAPESETRVCISATTKLSEYMHDMAQSFGFNLPRKLFISIEQARGGSLRGTKVVVAVDNVDVILRSMIRSHDIALATATGNLVPLFIPQVSVQEDGNV